MNNYTSLELCKVNRKILALEARRKQLEDELNGINVFINMYKDITNVPEFIFGTLSDEVLINILRFLPSKQILLGAPCTRFHTLREETLKILAMPKFKPYKIHEENLVQHVFGSKAILYYYMYRGLVLNDGLNFKIKITETREDIEIRVRAPKLGKPIIYTCDRNGLFYMDIGKDTHDPRVVKKSNSNGMGVCIRMKTYRINISKNADVTFEDSYGNPLELVGIVDVVNKTALKDVNRKTVLGLDK
jgi:hypothetical protein